MKRRLTEEEVSIRVKCGCYATDVTELCICLLTWLEDLKAVKEEQRAYKREIKQQTERMLNMVTLVCTNIRVLLKKHSPTFERSWNEVYDELIGLVDESVCLEGEERCVSLLITAIKIMKERIDYLKKMSFNYEGMSDIEGLLKLESIIRTHYKVEPVDLTIFFEKALSKVISQSERAEAKKKLEMGTNEYYNKKYGKIDPQLTLDMVRRAIGLTIRR